jgi:hypothetical protein
LTVVLYPLLRPQPDVKKLSRALLALGRQLADEEQHKLDAS